MADVDGVESILDILETSDTVMNDICEALSLFDGATRCCRLSLGVTFCFVFISFRCKSILRDLYTQTGIVRLEYMTG